MGDPFKELSNRVFRELSKTGEKPFDPDAFNTSAFMNHIDTKEKARLTPNGKYLYLTAFIRYAPDYSIIENLLEKTNGREGSIKDDAKANNRNADLSQKPKNFFRALDKLLYQSVSNKSPTARNRMVEILTAYEDFYDTHERDSKFIKTLYDLCPDSFNPVDDLVKGAMRGGSTLVKTSEGHKFSINSTRKNWTANNKYKKWVKKLTRKQRPNKKSEDLCVGSDSICKGDLGIPRKYMPQFDSPDEIQKFTRFVKRVYKIKSFKKTRKARQLKPSQGEINKKRIKGLIDDGVLEKVNIPLVVSGDNYVVDGHHRWAAYRLKKPDTSLPVMVIEAPIKDVLGIAVAWGAKHHEF